MNVDVIAHENGNDAVIVDDHGVVPVPERGHGDDHGDDHDDDHVDDHR